MKKRVPVIRVIVALVPVIRTIVQQLKEANNDGKITPEEVSDALLAGVAVVLDDVAPTLIDEL